MLILSRKIDEKITIEIPGMEPIQIMLTDVIGKKVRLGFDAPREYKIFRNETMKKQE